MEKKVAKSGRNRKWIKDRDEKYVYKNIVLDLFLHDEEGLHRLKWNFKWNFQHCIGAVDDKHIETIGCGMGSQYYNYKDTNSVVLVVVAGSNYEVTWVNFTKKSGFIL